MDPERILVIQLRRIGDVILTTPAVAALKARYPRARLDFLVEPPGAEALEGNPDIDEVLVYHPRTALDTARWWSKVRRRRYDWVIDFLGTPRSAVLTFMSGAKVKAGPAHVGHRWAYDTRLRESSTTRYAALEKILLLAPLGVPAPAEALPKLYLARRPESPENIVGLVPASRKETRRWPAESYAELGRRLRASHGCRVLVFWGPGERELAEEVARGIGEGAEATPPTATLRDAAALLARCRLVVTNCNGPKHMAVALGVPTVTVHGSSDPASWTPAHPLHRAVRRSELPCIGCRLNRCPTRMECLRELPVERVEAAALELLA